MYWSTRIYERRKEDAFNCDIRRYNVGGTNAILNTIRLRHGQAVRGDDATRVHFNKGHCHCQAVIHHEAGGQGMDSV